ncbi:VPLPA-CTERM sorting domain-containing protein [Meridianimarinicoccus sp. RP-17]|uniref:VPLPA-CTERM sorting domain-containing protein n=1 Tax=Meridianimarinicoccus zhengii TaxID=2056810 RepID=UPI000DAE5ED4|nr:VPLPA-CTERM sorting domain-containing protein [Phycocomes zhengii]
MSFCKSIGAAVVALCLSAGSAIAASYDFAFSFENVLHDSIGQGGTVTGFVRGLTEGTGAATSVEVASNTAGFGIGEYVGSPYNNSWTVTGGVLTAFSFGAHGGWNAAPDVTDSTLFFESTDNALTTGPRAGLRNAPLTVTTGFPGIGADDINLTFVPVDVVPDTPQVPLPATLPLALAGLAGFGLLRRRAA